MAEPVVTVQMLGALSLSYGEIRVSDEASRSYKLWLLLAYLIYHRHRSVPRAELLTLMGGRDRNADPVGALKTARMRARRLVEPLAQALGAELIVSDSGGYRWNPEVATVLDVEQFEALCQQAEQAPEAEQAGLYLQALALFQGEFLARLAGEPWVEQVSAYFSNRYLETVLVTVPLLEEAGRFQEAAALCRAALQSSPYHELLYRYLMKSLIGLGDYAGAEAVYQDLREKLFSELGVFPDEETQAVYQALIHQTRNQAMSTEAIRDKLREAAPPAGAMLCDFPTFQLFYQVEARSADRRGDAVHIGVLSVTGKHRRDLSDRSLKRAMDQLGEQLRDTLRVGDVAACCSACQYVALLVQANYENSQMVCQRVGEAFARAYPRSPALIQYTVLPLEPAASQPAQQP